jgi:phosphoglycerate kinase
VTLRILDDLVDIGGRRVFVRVDHNVPLKDGNVTDDARVRASLPTLTELLDAGTSLVVASHLGRPKGETRDELRMAPVADRLSELLERDVQALDEVVGDRVQAVCGHIEPGDVVYLENLRFDPREETNDTGLAGELADLADVYVDDAFGAVHRAHASVAALAELFVKEGRPAVAGRLLQEEVEALSRLLNDPGRPYVAVLGGAKVSDKLATIVALVERVDAILIGGAMAFTFLAADGGAIGDSLVEPESFGEVREARTRAAERGVLIQLPEDVVAASEVTAEASRSTVPASAIPRGMKGLDIGPRTVEEFARSIADAKTILWNGPMGVFELEPFGAGTRGIATAVAGANAYTVAGGGDSLAAVAKYGLQDGFDHLSTGGGASLEFLEGRSLPGIAVLETDR